MRNKTQQITVSAKVKTKQLKKALATIEKLNKALEKADSLLNELVQEEIVVDVITRYVQR